jgi:hypothetical protein
VSIGDGKPEPSWPTPMRLHEGEDWDVLPDLIADPPDGDLVTYRTTRHVHRAGMDVPVARLRRVGWLDQKGRVWLTTPPMAQFDGGSLTPLLIDAREG